ncbi:MAG: MBL fold metallo-hydrolase [Ignavibacteria bacterium]
MKNAILILLLIIICNETYSQNSATVCYIANEGFMVEASGKKILFDGLFGGFNANWCDVPTSDTKVKLEEATPPFDNIDLIFISHNHSDHFNKEMVVKHLLKNSKCKVVCPEQVYKKLESADGFKDIQNSVLEFTPDINRDTAVIIDGMKIKIYRLEHSRYMGRDSITGNEINLHQNVENIGFLLETDEIRVFHCGDINPWNEEQLKKFNLKDENIDIAFLERLFLTNREGKGIELINEYIKPRNTIFMHIDPKNREIYKQIILQISDVLPNVFIFDKSLECKGIILR